MFKKIFTISLIISCFSIHASFRFYSSKSRFCFGIKSQLKKKRETRLSDKETDLSIQVISLLKETNKRLDLPYQIDINKVCISQIEKSAHWHNAISDFLPYWNSSFFIGFHKDFIGEIKEKGTENFSSLAISFIALHEFAHIIQNTIPSITSPFSNKKRSLEQRKHDELQADCLAATMIKKSKLYLKQKKPELIFNEISKLHSSTFEGGSHGISQERKAAIQHGLSIQSHFLNSLDLLNFHCPLEKMKQIDDSIKGQHRLRAADFTP